MWIIVTFFGLAATYFLGLLLAPEETPPTPKEPDIKYRYYFNHVNKMYRVEGWYKHHGWTMIGEHTSEEYAKQHIKAIKRNENPDYKYYNGE